MNADPVELASQLIKRHEGFEQYPYKCTAGKTTIGYGRNIQDVGISKREAGFLLRCDIHDRLEYLEHFSFFKGLDPVRKAALLDLTYQIGRAGFGKFYKTISALEWGDFQKAHDEILDSKYAKHDTPERAKRIANMILEGVR